MLTEARSPPEGWSLTLRLPAFQRFRSTDTVYSLKCTVRHGRWMRKSKISSSFYSPLFARGG